MLDDEIKIAVADSGCGMPEGYDLQSSESLGLMLVKGLVVAQLHGAWNISSGKAGTEHTLSFKKTE